MGAKAGCVFLTALFLGLVRAVLAVTGAVAHFVAVDALAVFAEELMRALAFGCCRSGNGDTRANCDVSQHQKAKRRDTEDIDRSQEGQIHLRFFS